MRDAGLREPLLLLGRQSKDFPQHVGIVLTEPGRAVAMPALVGRDPQSLNRDGIIRAAVESVAESSSDGVIAPLFYLFLGGPAAAMAYKAINTLDR